MHIISLVLDFKSLVIDFVNFAFIILLITCEIN